MAWTNDATYWQKMAADLSLFQRHEIRYVAKIGQEKLGVKIILKLSLNLQ
jgi:hypothetical protein